MEVKMKNKKYNYVAVSIFVALLLSVSLSIIGFTQNNSANNTLSFKGKANKENFLLGEPIAVVFEISNNGENSIKVHNGGVETGFLKVLVSGRDAEYKQYFGYGWGLIMGRMFELLPSKSHSYKEATILWNGKIDVSGLSENAAKEKLKDRITTEYAFPEAGKYFIKGLSYVGENATPIESEPVQITISEPLGDDLTVWNQIKGNREIALLMQVGEFDTGKDEEKAKLVRQVEQILVQYPNSVYSSYLKTNLEKFKVKEERRQKFKENLKQQKN
jgi:hypothetical protein